jgi:hypothetical protein
MEIAFSYWSTSTSCYISLTWHYRNTGFLKICHRFVTLLFRQAPETLIPRELFSSLIYYSLSLSLFFRLHATRYQQSLPYITVCNIFAIEHKCKTIGDFVCLTSSRMNRRNFNQVTCEWLPFPHRNDSLSCQAFFHPKHDVFFSNFLLIDQKRLNCADSWTIGW